MKKINGIYFKKTNNSLKQKIIDQCIKGDYNHYFDQSVCFFYNHRIHENNKMKFSSSNANDRFSIISDSKIYNKEELLLKISGKENTTSYYSDSELILNIFKLYKYETPNIIDGAYSFVIWDEKDQEFFCCRSKTGRRTFYFYEDKNIFAFSSVCKSFFEFFGLKIELEDQYVKDLLMMEANRQEIDPFHTMYHSIKQIPPAHCLLIKNGKTRLWQYWKPEKKQEIALRSDHEYEEALVNLLNRAIQKRIGVHDKTGVLLSGGYDSGTVAALCSIILNKKDEKLTTFTSVPLAQYQNWLGKNKVADESSFVKLYQNHYDNMDMNFLDCEGKNSYLEIDSYIRIFEQPYLIFENSFWFVEAVKSAAQKNIKFLFTGQRGNSTISWGKFYPYLNFLIKQKKFKDLIKEIKSYSDLNNKTFRNIFIRLIYKKMPLGFKKTLNQLMGKNLFPSEYIPYNRTFINYYKQKKRFKKLELGEEFYILFDSLTQRINRLCLSTFSNSGNITTKLDLKYNVLIVDPTEDVDVIEFCLNLPENQFVRNGVERRLIKRTMKGYIPDKILNTNIRGKQSADWVQRIQPYWPVIKEELQSIGDFQLEKKYLDRNIIQKNLNMLEEFDFIRGDNPHMRILFRTLIFSRFLRMVEKGTLFDD